MALRDLVIHSQLLPPRPRKGILHRPRIQARLMGALDTPVTLILASTGYGKSTALSELVDQVEPLFWYVITEADRDPLLFLIHLISAFSSKDEMLGEKALRSLEENGGRATPGMLTPLMNALTQGLNRDAVLVMDDFHLVHDVPEINAMIRQLIQYLPPRLHIVISSRLMPENLDLTRYRMKGQLMVISHSDLAFTAQEIETLFNQEYGFPISPDQACQLAEETEGWGMAVQMVWQSLQSGAAASLDTVLLQLPETLEALFEYLAPEVLARQSPDVQEFLLKTSVLQRLSAPVCDALLENQSSGKLLRRILDSGLFLEALGDDTYRYQRLFQDFLQAQMQKDSGLSHELHRRAAEIFRNMARPEEAIYHWLEAGEMVPAADMIEAIGPDLVRTGRTGSLLRWIKRLPPEITSERPSLDLLMGDILRLRADFDAALEHFASAGRLYLQRNDAWGRSLALRGQAQVYLDTIRPLKADSLLEEALRLLEPQEYRQEVAALLDQLAENKLNLGHPDQAQSLHREARLLRAEISPNDVYLEARALLRTGHLTEARILLEQQATEERLTGQLRPQRFHRETVLLLSLVLSMLGEASQAEETSRAGIEIGRMLQSDFVEAVGFMRLGHALQVGGFAPWDTARREEAIRNYQRAIDQVHPFKVARVGVEPLWGLSRAYGYAGDLQNAEQKALRALEISEMAGDEWIGDLARTGVGASLAMAGQPEAAERWLNRASDGFRQVDDWFGWSAANLWLALNAWWRGDSASALELMSWLLQVVRANQYDVLLKRPSLIGLKDEQAVIPLLIETRRQNIEKPFLDHLLRELGVRDGEYHPGFTLWVRTLGQFNVWRGETLVASQDWQREKARQLFQLLLTCRGQWLLRDQIIDRLWPDLPMDVAVRDFKVALNAVNRALEPNRPRSAQSFFVIRNESTYGLNPDARIVVDADAFEQLLDVEDRDDYYTIYRLRRALTLYEDDYLPDCRYEDWAAPEVERLHQLYLSTAGRLARRLVDQRRWDEVTSLANSVLVRDNCWEPGYRYLMQAFAGKGNLPQVQNSYNRCVSSLREELGVEPSAETRNLLRRLVQTSN